MAVATAVSTDFDGSRYLILHLNMTGVDTTTEEVVIEAASTIVNEELMKLKLMEASWNINDGYDNAKLYFEDEGNDAVLLQMSGDGSADFSGYGGRYPMAVADASLVDEDMEVLIDVTEDGSENAASQGHITLVFKRTSISAVAGAPA